jgi:aconitate hydratase
MQKNSISSYEQTLFCEKKFYRLYSLPKLGIEKKINLERLPYSIRILLESCLRHQGESGYHEQQLDWLTKWQSQTKDERPAIAFLPARILMQDFTGLPVVNDFSALRAAMQRAGKDPGIVNPQIPADLVIDHSLTVEAFGCPEAQRINEEKEFQLNRERYLFLKWSQKAFRNLRVLPPGLGICHQVNLEYLGKVAFVQENGNGDPVIYPDSVMGTDSHTTMINGLGVAGWGVGGIEALAAMLGYPSEFPIPDVIGLELTGKLPENTTPTDLTLTITSRLREIGVVGKFVEMFGEGYASLPVETRAMIANMSPESGATMTYCPVDSQTLQYLHRSGRSTDQIELVEAYFQAQGLFLDGRSPVPDYTQILTINLDEIEPTISGPKRPHDIFPLSKAPQTFAKSLTAPVEARGYGLTKIDADKSVRVNLNGQECELKNGAVIIAAITSCTNTSDPGVVIAAGLLARNAARKGLKSKPWVKTSFAPGSRAVRAYLQEADLMNGLESLGFNVVGYGCTTCIGNSGPLPADVFQAIHDNQLVGAAVLSGNRNFEGRIHPEVRASFLASPPLVIAYALAGNMDFNFDKEPLGNDPEGKPVYLKDIYPSRAEILECTQKSIQSDIYSSNYSRIYEGNPRWNEMDVPASILYNWQKDSSVIREPAFLLEGDGRMDEKTDIMNAYPLAVLGDSITTDHISPAGRIAVDNPAGQYLQALGVKPENFISFGARRGNHEVMARGTFSNPRLHNELAGGREGGFTRHMPGSEILTIYEAARRYKEENRALIILAGKAYGSGSSRDWAAKGTYLLGVRAVIAESYERIHRTNLVCMGVLPLQFLPGENSHKLGLTGNELFSIPGSAVIDQLKPQVTVQVKRIDGSRFDFQATARIDTPLELAYYQAGGLMRKVASDL